MSNEASGEIHSDAPNRFVCNFVVDGSVYSYTAIMALALPNITIKQATLKYSTPDDLTGTHDFKGTVGTDLALTISNGPTMAGKLAPPVIDPVAHINGNGVWSLTVLGE
ncbi:hypothetical protein PsYK624_121710 [Phanerochaete sordida]|uniref:Uncharacterized protein n=1 Tax=Phanerochaete sordida TaxID=48140 RepID=A0A9P3GJB0_9APHY|nr:hypothetical protein PsYK624_121710 [Phanerochaete sordida]